MTDFPPLAPHQAGLAEWLACWPQWSPLAGSGVTFHVTETGELCLKPQWSPLAGSGVTVWTRLIGLETSH